MLHSSSLATLIVVSRLSRSPSNGLASTTGLGGTGRATADEMLYVASFVLAVAFSATANGPGLLDLVERESAVADGGDVPQGIEEYTVVDNDKVKELWMQRSRVSPPRNIRHRMPPTPEIDGTERRPRISTRRQRRKYDTSSCNYSDFCNTNLSRRIEAMASEVETAYANRRVTKSEHVIDQESYANAEQLMIKSVEPAPRNDLTSKIIKEEPSSSPMMKMFQHKTSEPTKTASITNKINPPQMLLHDHQKTSKSIEDTPRFQLLRRALQTIKEDDEDDDHMPAMKPCDSLSSFASDYSFSTRSSSDFLDASPAKKSWRSPPKRNAEWAIME